MSSNIEDIREFVLSWNVKYPIDRWYRERYKMPFNSAIHRDTFLIDILIEWEEYQLYKDLLTQEEYKPNTNNWMKKVEDTRTEEQKAIDFENEVRERFKQQRNG